MIASINFPAFKIHLQNHTPNYLLLVEVSHFSTYGQVNGLINLNSIKEKAAATKYHAVLKTNKSTPCKINKNK